MKDLIKQNVDDYKRTLAEKINVLQQLRSNAMNVEAEINMLNGAIQACEKLLKSDDDSRKTK